MKKIILIFGFLFAFFVSFSQLSATYMGDSTEVTGTDTISFRFSVASGYKLDVAVGFILNTVNTSSFQGSFYIDQGFGSSLGANGLEWVNVQANENYSFTQTADEKKTLVLFECSEWITPEIRARVITESDAQSIMVQPWIQTVR